MNILTIICLLFNGYSVNLPKFSNSTPNSFYLGVEGFVYIQMNNCEAEDVNVKISSGYINKRNDSTFTFFPQTEGEEIKLKLYYKKVICQVKTVTTKKLPEIIPAFEIENNSTIKIKDLGKVEKLTQTYPEGFPEELKTEIYSFHLIMVNDAGIILYNNTIRGNGLDENALNAVKKLTKGSKILISNMLMNNKYRGISRIQTQKEITISD